MQKHEFIIVTKDELESIIQATAEKMIKLLPPSQSTNPPGQTEYITRAETAKRLKISLPTLWKLTKEGKITAYKIGRKVLYNPDDVHNLTRKMDFDISMPKS
jgi:excisionase family DNA binding protein